MVSTAAEKKQKKQSLKKLIKKNKFLYKNCKKIQTHLININRFKCNYKFQNRSKNEKCLCIVLSEYKTFLMDDVFERIIKFKKEKMEHWSLHDLRRTERTNFSSFSKNRDILP